MKKIEINVKDEVIDDLNYRLNHVKLPDMFGSNWERGIDKSYFLDVITYWKTKYDWHKQLAKINQFSHYLADVDELKIHFIYEKGKGKNPKPIILTHGWPDSFIRYIKIIDMLTDPVKYGGSEDDSFDVIIPSIPGFFYSDYPKNRSYNNEDTSELWFKLMTNVLGYQKFMVSGGDMGSGISRYLAANHSNHVIGLHLTDVGIIRPLMVADDQTLNEEELAYKKQAQQWMNDEGGYMTIQSTKPNTLAYGLTDSPVGLAAWIIEKFHGWSDHQSQLNIDDVLTNVMIHWISGSIGSSNNIYYENTHGLKPIGSIAVPTALLLFKKDVLLPPIEWVKKHYPIIQLSTTQSGGHFTALEAPEQFVEDIRAFSRKLR